MSWRAVLLVTAWEFRRRVLSRGFWLATLLLPLIPFGVVGLIVLLVSLNPSTTRQSWEQVALYDATGSLIPSQLPAGVRVSTDSSAWHRWQEELRQERLQWIVVVTDSTLRHGMLTVYGLRKELPASMRQALEQHLLRSAALARGVDSLTASLLIRGLRWQTTLLATPKRSVGAAIGAATLVAILLFALLAGYGSTIAESILEEKEDRVAELLVGTTRPMELLVGKVIGIGAVGMFQLLCWAFLFGIFSLVFSLPVAIQVLRDATPAVNSELANAMRFADATTDSLRHAFWLVVVSFSIGYMLYAGLFATVAAVTVNRTQAAPLHIFVLIPLIAPVTLLGVLLEFPDSVVGRVFTLVPLTAPVMLPFRALVGELSWWEALTATGTTLALTVGMFWLAGKLYRVGMLHYSGVPTWRLLVQWLRQVG